MSTPATPAGHLRIGELARRTNVTPEVLRAWERRYGLLRPSRSSGGYRLYTEDDERRVRLMRRHVDEGIAPAEAARLALDADVPPATAAPAAVPGALEEARTALRDSLDAYQEVAAQAVLDRLLGAFSAEMVIGEVILPHLREVGERWHRGELSVAQEHFGTQVLRSRLLGLARGWDDGLGPRAILACPPHERHDGGLIAFGVGLRGQGWRITYFGPDTPVSTVAGAAAALAPAEVVLGAVNPERFTDVEDELAELAAAYPVSLGGPGATPEIAGRIGARLLSSSPFAAARELTAPTGRSPRAPR